MCQIRDNTKQFLTEATDESCDGLKRALDSTGCAGFECDAEDGNIFIASCDDQNPEPVKFCPFCGTPMEVQS